MENISASISNIYLNISNKKDNRYKRLNIKRLCSSVTEGSGFVRYDAAIWGV